MHFSRNDLKELENIFDDAITTRESCRNRVAMAVFFEDGKALVAEDFLFAIYDVLKMV